MWGGWLYRVRVVRRENMEGWTHLLTEFTISCLQLTLDMSAVCIIITIITINHHH